MAKSPDQIVADIDAAQIKEDLELPKRVAKAAKKVYDAATSKGEDFEPKTAYMDGNFSMPTTEPVRSPVDVGAGVRSLNMGKKSAVGSEGVRSGMKKGGEVKSPTMSFQTYTKTGKKAGMKTVPVKMAKGGSASARADGCAIRGKTRA